MTKTVAATLGEFVAGLDESSVPPEVLETARVALAHNIGVALAGGRLAQPALRWASRRREGDEARELLTGRGLAAIDAVFVNACLIHARAQDDTYFPGLTHVGAATVPAVLALGEREGATLGDVLAAMVAGYEVAAAISAVAAPTTTSYGFRGSGIYGVFGAAAGSARLLGLDATQTAHALAIAASFAAGTNQTWVDGSMEWQYQLGAASRSGLEAAELAAVGATGASRAFEGGSGFFAAFARDAALGTTVASGLGARWATLDVTFKKYPVCAILQSPVEAAVSVMSRAQGREIERATLALSPPEAEYPGTDGTPPFDDAGAALMSASYCVSTALTRASVTVEDLFSSAEPARIAQAGIVGVESDPGLGAREFRITVKWDDGQIDEVSDVGYSSAWGRAELSAILAGLGEEVPAGVDLTRLEAETFGPLGVPITELLNAIGPT